LANRVANGSSPLRQTQLRERTFNRDDLGPQAFESDIRAGAREFAQSVGGQVRRFGHLHLVATWIL
jgi:hypothetical protein